jgi:hypothetical protein
MRCVIVCNVCTITADVQLCVPYVQLLQYLDSDCTVTAPS